MTNDYLIIYVRLFYMKTDASLVPVFICPRRKVAAASVCAAPTLQYRRFLGAVFKV